MDESLLGPEVEAFVGKAKTALAKLKRIDNPIREISKPSWKKVLDTSAEGSSPLRDLGAAQLSGEITAGAWLTKVGHPPLEDSDLAGDPDETRTAWASLRIAGGGDPSLCADQPIAGGGKLSGGVSADGRLTLAHHRRYSQAKKAVVALLETLEEFTTPYQVGRVHRISERDVLQAEISGSVVLRADASWTWGLARALDGETLEKLRVKEPVAIQAGAALGLTVNASVEGRMRVIVTTSPDSSPDRQLVRLQLLKHRGSFVGAGLKLTAGLNIENSDAFVDGLLGQLLQLPDDLLEELSGLRGELNDLRGRLGALEDEAQDAIARAAGKAADEIGLDDLQVLVEKLEQAPPAVQSLVRAEKLDQAVRSALGRVADLQTELVQFVDDAFGKADGPLEQADARLGSWIDGYNALRKKAAGFVERRAKQGASLDLAAGINRSHANDALLDLEFDLDLAADLYRQAVRGNFSPALQAARPPATNGVRVLAGTLTDTTTRRTFSNLTLNLFGFELKKDLQAWDEVGVVEDLAGGSLELTGQAGASLEARLGKSTLRALSFMFDLTAAAERRDGKLFLTDPEAAYRATLVRSASLAQERQIRTILPLHLSGAVSLGLLDEDSARSLRQRLAAAEGTYTYDLDLAFPVAAIQRAFLFEKAAASQAEIRAFVWGALRRAVRGLDMLIPAVPDDCPLSLLMTPGAIEEVSRNIDFGFRRRFRAPRPVGYKLPSGSHALVWTYIQQARVFVEAYLEARTALLDGKPARKINAKLRKLAKKTRSTPGYLSTKPLDAKYLALALLAGGDTEVSLTFGRGDVRVTL